MLRASVGDLGHMVYRAIFRRRSVFCRPTPQHHHHRLDDGYFAIADGHRVADGHRDADHDGYRHFAIGVSCNDHDFYRVFLVVVTSDHHHHHATPYDDRVFVHKGDDHVAGGEGGREALVVLLSRHGGGWASARRGVARTRQV